MNDRHYHVTHAAPDGTIYKTCGFWKSEELAVAAVSDAHPDHVITYIEPAGIRCTA